MLIPYILSGSITVLSQRSTAASKDARSGRPGLAPRPADPAVNVPGFPRFAAARADLRWGRIPEFLANTGAGDIALAAGQAVARDLLLAVLGILAGAVLAPGGVSGTSRVGTWPTPRRKSGRNNALRPPRPDPLCQASEL
jgi:hypothetical protein